MISMILIIAKARVVNISRGKVKGFRLYWMGKYPSNYRMKKKLWVKYKKFAAKKWVVEKSG